MNRDRSEKPSLSDRGLSDPQLSDRGRVREDEKRQRLAEALRDNLRKRKAQSRDRAADGNASVEAKTPGAKP